MIISQGPEEIKAAFALQAKCDLSSVVLKDCTLSSGVSSAAFKNPCSVQLSHHSSKPSSDNGLLVVDVTFDTKGVDSSEPPKVQYSLTCTFELVYRIEDKEYTPSEEACVAFGEGNAVFNCWPYAREFVHSMTRRMGLPVPPLPLLKIVPKPRDPSLSPAIHRRRHKLIPTESPTSELTDPTQASKGS